MLKNKMKHRLPQLERLKVFERAATFLSFSQAADQLCVTKGAVSYQVRKLEEELGTQLFKRGVRQVLLTDDGQVLLKSVLRAFAELEGSLLQITRHADHCVIRIAATTYVAARWLSRRVARFSEKSPKASFIFQHSVNDHDFNLDGVDIAIRWGACSTAIDGSRWRELPMPLFAAGCPALVKKYALARKTVLPGEVPLLCEHREQDLWGELFSGQMLSNPRHIIADANVRVQAAIDGQGLIMADAMMQMELNTGLLVSPMDRRLTGYGYIFMLPRKEVLTPLQYSFLDWLEVGPTETETAST